MIDLSAADALRYLCLGLFGLGCSFMAATNLISYYVLRVPKQLGFLWWHVTAISISFVLISLVALAQVFERLGSNVTWRLPTLLVGLTLFAVAQGIIFTVERARLMHHRAEERKATRHVR